MSTLTSRSAPATPEYEHFFAAVRSNNLVAVEKSLENNINVNLLQGDPPDGISALCLAALYGSPELVKLLLSRGAEVNLQDSDLNGSGSPLLGASWAAQHDNMQVLLDHGADWNKKSIEAKHREAIKLLIEHGADIYAVHQLSGETVLDQAAEFGDIELLKYFLTVGFGVDHRSWWSDTRAPNTPTPICVATSNGRIEAVKFLIESGARVDNDVVSSAKTIEMFDLVYSNADKESLDSCTVLHRACRRDDAHFVSRLLAAGLDVNARDEEGTTPLTCAVALRACSLEVIQLLIEKGADVSAKIKVEGTALHRAAWFSRPEIVTLLIKASCDLNARNSLQQTPLHVFAKNAGSSIGINEPICLPSVENILKKYVKRAFDEETHPRLQTLRMLVNAESEVNAQDIRGRTPLHEIMLNDHTIKDWLRFAAARILLNAGASVDISDADGKTVRDIVRTQEHPGFHALLA